MFIKMEVVILVVFFLNQVWISVLIVVVVVILIWPVIGIKQYQFRAELSRYTKKIKAVQNYLNYLRRATNKTPICRTIVKLNTSHWFGINFLCLGNASKHCSSSTPIAPSQFWTTNKDTPICKFRNFTLVSVWLRRNKNNNKV